jgi:hypothetical protein
VEGDGSYYAELCGLYQSFLHTYFMGYWVSSLYAEALFPLGPVGVKRNMI